MNWKLVGLGELLWDLLPEGRQMGGAPANFAYHAASLGAESRVISRVGNDPLGHALLEQLKGLGLPTDGVQVDPVLPTSTVTVDVDTKGEPRFQIHEGVAWDNLSDDAASRETVAAADAICFGTLAQRSEKSRSTLQSLVRSAAPGALKILDVNLRQHFYTPQVILDSLAISTVLKVNDLELPRLADLLELRGDPRSQISRIAEQYSLRAVACTRGGQGSLLWVDGVWSDHPGVPTRVQDTVGAGDSFTAAMALGILAGWSADAINQIANEVAAYVASCSGATPQLPDSLRGKFKDGRAPV